MGAGSIIMFALFCILGWVSFMQPSPGNTRLGMMIVFIVLLMFWLLVGVTGFEFSSLRK